MWYSYCDKFKLLEALDCFLTIQAPWYDIFSLVFFFCFFLINVVDPFLAATVFSSFFFKLRSKTNRKLNWIPLFAFTRFLCPKQPVLSRQGRKGHHSLVERRKRERIQLLPRTSAPISSPVFLTLCFQSLSSSSEFLLILTIPSTQQMVWVCSSPNRSLSAGALWEDRFPPSPSRVESQVPSGGVCVFACSLL